MWTANLHTREAPLIEEHGDRMMSNNCTFAAVQSPLHTWAIPSLLHLCATQQFGIGPSAYAARPTFLLLMSYFARLAWYWELLDWQDHPSRQVLHCLQHTSMTHGHQAGRPLAC